MPNADLSQTQSFLLQLIHPRAEVPCPAFIEDAPAWSEVFECAERLGVEFLVWQTLREASWRDAVPPSVTLWAEERANRDRLEGILLKVELEDALKAIVQAGVPALLTGEIEIALRSYPDPSRRPCADAEIIVRPEDFRIALRALGKAGFRMANPFSEAEFRAELKRASKAPRVHLQINGVPSDSEEIRFEIWNRSVVVLIPGIPISVRAPKLEDGLALHLRRGAREERFSSPVWLRDFYYLLKAAEKTEVDWDLMVWAMAEQGTLAASWFALSFVTAHWGAVVPDSVMEAASRSVAPWRRKLIGRFARPEICFASAERSLERRFGKRLLHRLAGRSSEVGVGQNLG